ncbi:MAG: CcoQ/FixQ family Cbb3-type cytochrome c oxidase assembly chaperone [Ideonella sp.]|nr:CcoQ/FixQ family Cbb3-type cytochrome c oxidase assembly chaperone [Ideonella sp.]MCC7457720.1 CcoQ/FixQ family Cbb3-type cytochrome c oxidase assembly chaperone [Nitrospira sp.]
MNINDIRSAITVLSLLVFLGIVAWAWSSRRRAAFAEAAQLPFVDTRDAAQGAVQGAAQGVAIGVATGAAQDTAQRAGQPEARP